MDIVERLRTKKEQYIATVEWGLGTWEELADSDRPDADCIEAADEIERLREALRLAGDRVEPLASFQQKDIGSSTIRVGEETKFSRDARSFNGEK